MTNSLSFLSPGNTAPDECVCTLHELNSSIAIASTAESKSVSTEINRCSCWMARRAAFILLNLGVYVHILLFERHCYVYVQPRRAQIRAGCKVPFDAGFELLTCTSAIVCAESISAFDKEENWALWTCGRKERNAWEIENSRFSFGVTSYDQIATCFIVA